MKLYMLVNMSIVYIVGVHLEFYCWSLLLRPEYICIQQQLVSRITLHVHVYEPEFTALLKPRSHHTNGAVAFLKR